MFSEINKFNMHNKHNVCGATGMTKDASIDESSNTRTSKNIS